MNTNKTTALTAKQNAAMKLMLEGKSQPEIAKELDMTVGAISKWCCDPEFKAELRRISSNFMYQAGLILADTTTVAANNLREMIRDKRIPSRAYVSVVQLSLDMALKYQDHLFTNAELDDLRDEVDDLRALISEANKNV